ncbi:LOW QUALITY PROTEIN: protein FAM227B [Ciconia maguari]
MGRLKVLFHSLVTPGKLDHLDVFTHSEKRINTCITELEKHAEKKFSLQCGPAYLEEHLMPLNRSYNYPRFKVKQLASKRHLEAPKLWDLVIKAQHFQPNQEDQDHLFDRIADLWGHFLLVPRDAKDAFFQVYPECLSQVIYVAFYEAFPESIKCFDNDFKGGLVDLIFQWISVDIKKMVDFFPSP